MNEYNLTFAARISILMCLVILVGLGKIALAQPSDAGVPANASANTYGTGWRCDSGFRKVDDACVVVIAPANAFLTDGSYGTGWECARGFRKSQAGCVAIVLPENAHLNFSGNDWDCNTPYRKVRNTCMSGERNE